AKNGVSPEEEATVPEGDYEQVSPKEEPVAETEPPVEAPPAEAEPAAEAKPEEVPAE
ncbi:MAG: hypothetical protein QOE13_1664, partial [Gaiellaceae bacterium]|nr:hypothetical protein [Gaiellaceae bacterium]